MRQFFSNLYEFLNKGSGLLLKLLAIMLICLAIFYFGLSLYANFTENPNNPHPEPPPVEKAHYVVTIRNTGERIYTDSYNSEPSPNDDSMKCLTLYEYWEVRDGRYMLFKHSLVIDEFYFGSIIIERRQG